MANETHTPLRIAQIRAVPQKGELQANYDTLMSILQTLDGHKVDVVVTPECFLDGYVSTESQITASNIADYAIDPVASDFVDGVSRWSRDHAAWVILGCSRRAATGVYNSALVLNRRGRLTGVYDKIHCQTHDTKYLRGQTLSVFDSEFGPFGVMICADRRWPETVRSLALQGARIIFNPTYGLHDRKNLRMMQTRSYESEVFIAFTHPRQSLLTDPTGEIVANDTHDDTSFSICDVDLALVDKVRTAASAHLRDRRPDLYTS